MPRWARILAGLAAAGAVGGFLVAWSGIIHVGASTGHWKITEWLLHWAMIQSVETHSLGIEAPPLDDPALARRGAGHYAGACAPCHGAPGVKRSAVALAMTPKPPFLPERAPAWEPEELFWIVRHGVKMTAMPAWPALAREDEVWAVVAFLRRLPELDDAGYRRLAFGEAAPAETVPGSEAPALAACVRCHGRDGAGDGAFPRLAGQSETYLHAALEAFANGSRASGMMEAAVYGLGEAELRALAGHYAEAAVGRQQTAGGSASAETQAGERLAREGDPSRGIPPCASCHGLAAGPRYAAYPSLAGQQVWYLEQQLRLLRAGLRGGSPYAHIMRAVAARLDDDQIAAAAAFYARLGGGAQP